MGHVRLGRLPSSRDWRQIVGYVVAGDISVAELADAVADASDKSLMKAIRDPALIEVIWLLMKIPQAARSQHFSQELNALGISVPTNPSVTDVVAGFDAAVEAVQRQGGKGITDLGEMAKQAGIAALHGVVQDRLPSLWVPTREDERTTLASLDAPDRFGDLSQRFFSRLVEHNIQYFLDREMPKHIGPDQINHSIGDMAAFDGAVRRHCEETTVIMRAYAKDWLGNHGFHQGKNLSRKDASNFSYTAFEKIRSELSVRRTAHVTV